MIFHSLSWVSLYNSISFFLISSPASSSLLGSGVRTPLSLSDRLGSCLHHFTWANSAGWMYCASVGGSWLSTLSPSKSLSPPQPVALSMGYSVHLHQLPEGCCFPPVLYLTFLFCFIFLFRSRCFFPMLILKLFVSLCCVQRLLLISMALLFSYHHNCLFLLAHGQSPTYMCWDWINCLGWFLVPVEDKLQG